MACTTILVGRHASYDGSTIVARNEDSPNGKFEPQKMMVVHPEDQPRTYTSVLSHLSFHASYDGSTIVARNEDSPNGKFEPQKMMVVHPEDQPRTYTSVLSHLSF